MTSFTCALGSSVTVSKSHVRAGPLSLKEERCFHISHHIGLHRFAHCALNPHWHFVDPRLAARAHRTAAEDACLLQAVAGGEEIYLHPSDQVSFRLFVAPWHHQLFHRCYTCVTPLEIMPIRVLVQKSVTETQHVSMNGNFALDNALLVKLVIKTLKH